MYTSWCLAATADKLVLISAEVTSVSSKLGMAIQTLSKINYLPKAHFRASYPVEQFLSFKYMSEDRLSASRSHMQIYRETLLSVTLPEGEKTQKCG